MAAEVEALAEAEAEAASVEDSELVSRLREILRDSDLEKATASSVRRQLEEDFGVDLSGRKAFIREQIDIYLQDLGGGGEDADGDDGNVKAEEGEAEADDEGDEAEAEAEVEDEEGTRSRKRRKKSDTESKRTGGFNKLCSLSAELQSFVGVPALARPQVVKRMWSYIKEKNLQDPKDKRKIICDDALYSLFRVKSINMFQMNKALARHIWPLNPEDENAPIKAKNQEDADFRSTEEGKNSAKEIEEEEKNEDEETVEEGVSGRGRKKKRSKESKGVKKRGGGFTKVCSLSEQLQVFTGASELARTEVVKLLWNYIRENNLQDPSNKRRILCDESLRALFKVDAIDMFQMNKALSKHIWPRNEEASEKLSCTGGPCEQPKDEGEVGEEDNQQKGSSNVDSS